jgi:hypothetical protein
MATSKANEGFLQQAAGIVASTYQAVMKDGTIAAAGRQGADELGAALKAFPDSIQMQESGTIFNPTQGEIADARQADEVLPSMEKPRLPSPSEIAAETRLYQPEQGNGLEQGNSR